MSGLLGAYHALVALGAFGISGSSNNEDGLVGYLGVGAGWPVEPEGC